MTHPQLRLVVCLLVALSVGCRTSDADNLAAVVALETEAVRFSDDVATVEQKVGELSGEWRDVVETYRRAASLAKAAGQIHREAGEKFARAEAASEGSRQTFDDAAARWKIARMMIVLATAVDASHLGSTQRVGDRTVEGQRANDCTRVSTRSYRRMLERRGVRLTPQQHIDHIVPHNLGGADHPLNYRVLPATENIAWSDTWNATKCADAGLACAAAVLVSTRCGSFRM